MQNAGNTYAIKPKEMIDFGKSADAQRETMGPPAVRVWNSLIQVASKQVDATQGEKIKQCI
eukprot:4268298-Lingulodinium_polyedra.AAC.1